MHAVLSRGSWRTLGCLAIALLAFATPGPGQSQPVKVGAEAPAPAIPPGTDFPLAVTFTMDPEWHVGPPPEMLFGEGAEAYPTTIKVVAPEGVELLKHQWPAPQPLEFAGEEIEAYEGKLVVYVPVRVPEDATGTLEFSFEVEYQTCDHHVCLMPQTVDRKVQVQIQGDAAAPALTGIFEKFDAKVFGAAMANAGGDTDSGDSGDAGGAPDDFLGGGPDLFGEGPVRVSVHGESAIAPPGADLRVAVVFDIDPGWHMSPPKFQLPEDAEAYPTTLTLTLPPGFTQHAPIWPDPHEVDFLGEQVLAFDGKTVAYLPLRVPETASGEVVLKVGVEYQACDDMKCNLPQTETFDVRLEVQPGSSLAVKDAALFPAGWQASSNGDGAGPESSDGKDTDPSDDDGIFETNVFGWHIKFDATGVTGTALLLLMAALGGLILNLTPCVLPIIPLKIMSLTKTAGNPARSAFLGTVMCVGIVTFWLVLAGMILGLKEVNSISSLFQTPYFSIGVGFFVALMGMGMMGLFDVALPQAVYMVNPSHESVRGSFMFGVMTAVLSTPCTAPFMGTAAAWATKRNDSAVVLAVFAAIGIGMALPYEILAFKPGWVSRLPKAGPGSDALKQVMGLFMLAVACFFGGAGLNSLVTEYPYLGPVLYWWFTTALVFLSCAWMIYRTFQISPRLSRRLTFTALGVLIAFGMFQWANFQTTLKKEQYERADGDNWVAFNWKDFDQALADGHVVAVEFTADW